MDTSLNTPQTSNPEQVSTQPDRQQYDLAKHSEEKPIVPKKKNNQSKNTGHWNTLQKELYSTFLKAHRENFVNRESRRTDKIFKEMAKFIKTRAADQCRSHHQKMQKKFSSFDDILDSMQQTPSNKECQEMMKTFLNETTRYTSVICPSTSDATETDEVNLQASSNQIADCESMRFCCVDELQLGISSPGVFYQESFNIDNYFLI